MDFNPYRQTAIAAAYKSAKILQARFGDSFRIRKKAAMEIVTEADVESEKQIISTIHGKFPDHAVLGEECGLRVSASEYKWIIDPLDGTVNFAHQVPIFCISIALTYREDIVVSIDGQRVSSQHELSEVVAARAPGDQVALRFRRGDHHACRRCCLHRQVVAAQ